MKPQPTDEFRLLFDEPKRDPRPLPHGRCEPTVDGWAIYPDDTALVERYRPSKGAIALSVLVILAVVFAAMAASAQTISLQPGNGPTWEYDDTLAQDDTLVAMFEVRYDGPWIDAGKVRVGPGVYVGPRPDPEPEGIFNLEVRVCEPRGADDLPHNVNGPDPRCTVGAGPQAYFIGPPPTTLPPIDDTTFGQAPIPTVAVPPPPTDTLVFHGACVLGTFTPVDVPPIHVINQACEPVAHFSAEDAVLIETCRREVCLAPCGTNDCWRWDLWPSGPVTG